MMSANKEKEYNSGNGPAQLRSCGCGEAQSGLGCQRGTLLFALFFLGWVAYNYPASLNPWWFKDDFNSYDPVFSAWGFIRSGLYNGRILLGPILIPLLWDAPPETNGINVLHRLVQMAMHAGVGVLIVSLLMRRLSFWASVCCGAVYTFWCFHGQATMWLAAAIYPVGGVLSLLGVILILKGTETARWKKAATGAICLALAMHANQVSAIIGVLTFGIILVLGWLEDMAIVWRRLFVRLVWMGAGLFIGFLGNYLLMLRSGHLRMYRPEWADRVAFLEKYLKAFVYDFEAYSPAVSTGHLMVGGFFLGAVGAGLFVLRKQILPLGAAFILPLVLGVGALSPLLFSGSLFASFRVFYLLPIIISGTMAVIFMVGKRLPFFHVAGLVLSVWMLLAYLGPTRQNAADLLSLYHHDVETYRSIERAAMAAGTERVLFMDRAGANGFDHNPYDLITVMEDNLESVLHNSASNYRALWYFTDLKNVDWWLWEDLRKKYGDLAAALPREKPFMFVHIPEEDFLLVVPR